MHLARAWLAINLCSYSSYLEEGRAVTDVNSSYLFKLVSDHDFYFSNPLICGEISGLIYLIGISKQAVDGLRGLTRYISESTLVTERVGKCLRI